MKQSFAILASIAALMMAGATSSGLAGNTDVTLAGDAQCGKCILKKSPTCQMVIQVQENGKKHNYWVVENPVSKAFKEDVCAAPKKVTATGTVKMVKERRQMTLSKIALAK